MAQANSMQASGSKLDNRRVLAALIDLAVVGAGGAVILAAAGVLGESPSEIGAPLLASIAGWALYYYFACESGGGQTLGKRAMRLRVVSENGSPADMRAIGLRTVLRVVDMQLAGIVGLVVMNSTKERRARLGDLVGGTKVVSAEGQATGRPQPKATVVATPVSRVPIGESGPAFAAVPSPEAEQDAEVVEAPSVEAEPEVVFEAPLAEVDAEPDVATASLRELASDVSAVTADPDREVAEEPAAEAEEAEADEVEVHDAELDEAPTMEADALEPDAPEVHVLDAPAAEADAGDDDGLDDGLIDDDPLAGADDEADAEEELDPEAEEAAALEAHEAEVEGRVSVKSVQTVSAMDIVMDEGGDSGRSDSSADR
jgi:uncharacterized RDD family membrane protein YckC